MIFILPPGNVRIMVLFLASLCYAQDDNQTSQELNLAVEVRMVTVEAIVTDGRGNPVTGLQKEDFELLVDKKITPIAFFSEHVDSRQSDEKDAVQVVDLNSPAAEIEGQESGENYVVFLDDFYTNRFYRQPVIKKLIEDLALLGPNDKMALLRFKGKNLEIDAELTHDRELLEAAFRKALKEPSGELARKARVDTRAHDIAKETLMDEQLGRVIKAIMTAMDRYHKVPGRKTLFLVSEGWEILLPTPKSGLANLLQVRSLWQEKVDDLVDAATRFEFTVYPLELIPNPALVSVDEGIYDAQTEIQSKAQKHFIKTVPLHTIAKDTGGQVIPQAFAQSKVVEVAAEDSAAYYTLGFQAENDDERHDIRIRVNGKKVRHRRHFKFLDQEEKAETAVETALLVGTGNTQLEVQFSEPTKRRFRKLDLPVQMKIPMDWVTMKALGNGRYTCDLELRISAQDRYGDRAQVAMTPISLESDKPEKGSFVIHEVLLRVRKREQRLVFSLQDTNSGETLSQSLDFKP